MAPVVLMAGLAIANGPIVRTSASSMPRGLEIRITVQIDDPSPYEGVLVDYWVLGYEVKNGTWWYCVPPYGAWMQVLDVPHPRYQGPLERVPPTVVADTPTLEVGEYIVYFGVDRMDGMLNLEEVWYSSAAFTILPYDD